LPGLVVAELKQPRSAHDSPFLALAREAHLHPSGFSKYCIGVSLLYPGIKHNAFKPELGWPGTSLSPMSVAGLHPQGAAFNLLT
jgi:hypothetical protein